MTHPPTEEQIFATVSTILVEALLVDFAAIKMESKIFDDLGAESIDVLDIRFRMEQAFSCKIDQDKLVRSLGEDLNSSEIQKMFTVGSLVKYMKDQLQSRVKT
jgi:acyl carrier protein